MTTISMIEEHDGYQCYRLKTAAAAKLLETKLIHAGKSFKTKINVTRKHGREFIVQLLD